MGRVNRACRPGQEVDVTDLGSFDPQAVDMQTVLVIGNSATRRAGDFILTPRGYDRKYDLAPDPRSKE